MKLSNKYALGESFQLNVTYNRRAACLQFKLSELLSEDFNYNLSIGLPFIRHCSSDSPQVATYYPSLRGFREMAKFPGFVFFYYHWQSPSEN